MEKSEVIEIIKNGHIAQGLLSFAMHKGALSISLKKELWQHKVDQHWEIACNGQDKKVDEVPPFSWYIKFNGWPAGILGIMGDGILCAGAAGNEENLRQALLDNIFNEQN